MEWQSQTLRERLTTWQDDDIAAYRLACALGLMGPEDGSFDRFRDAKHIFWSADPLGDLLHRMLLDLVAIGILESRNHHGQFRWNPEFRGTWET